jgi:hypothetical protein
MAVMKLVVAPTTIMSIDWFHEVDLIVSMPAVGLYAVPAESLIGQSMRRTVTRTFGKSILVLATKDEVRRGIAAAQQLWNR